jgi:hypothetical protein
VKISPTCSNDTDSVDTSGETSLFDITVSCLSEKNRTVGGHGSNSSPTESVKRKQEQISQRNESRKYSKNLRSHLKIEICISFNFITNRSRNDLQFVTKHKARHVYQDVRVMDY